MSAPTVHYLDMLRVTVDQPDFVAGLGQQTADGAAERASALNRNFQNTLLAVAAVLITGSGVIRLRDGRDRRMRLAPCPRNDKNTIHCQSQ